jgi:AraC-like DNA-binding protein
MGGFYRKAGERGEGREGGAGRARRDGHRPGRKHPSVHSSGSMTDYSESITAVKKYIGDHLTDPLDLGTLAQTAGFSMYHFSRIFYAYAGVPVMKYVKAKRLEKAVCLLDNTGSGVSEIALRCGFNSISLFGGPRWDGLSRRTRAAPDMEFR